MGAYQQTFGFREPYQILLDSAMIAEATRCAMVIPEALERTVRGTVKPSTTPRLHPRTQTQTNPPPLVITHCTLRHLFSLPPGDNPQKESFIAAAKTFELRKCNHHELPAPLPEKECFESVVIKNGENKHRYCIAAQDREVKDSMREIPGVPCIVINRSVMILEAMTEASKYRRDGLERGKFVKGIVDARKARMGLEPAAPVKRKRVEEGGEGEDGKEGEEEVKKKKKKAWGVKGVNPLAAKKKAPKPAKVQEKKVEKETPEEGAEKKKRKRKHKSAGATAGGGEEEAQKAVEA